MTGVQTCALPICRQLDDAAVLRNRYAGRARGRVRVIGGGAAVLGLRDADGLALLRVEPSDAAIFIGCRCQLGLTVVLVLEIGAVLLAGKEFLLGQDNPLTRCEGHSVAALLLALEIIYRCLVLSFQ